MTRTEHLQWCKDRAMAYCDQGDLSSALASMGSDLAKHPETDDQATIKLGLMLLMSGHLDTPAKMRRFIEGFN